MFQERVAVTIRKTVLKGNQKDFWAGLFLNLSLIIAVALLHIFGLEIWHGNFD